MKIYLLIGCYALIVSVKSKTVFNEVTRPHIVFILADDLGWNDVGFHGSAQIPTPNIDALAYSGVILNRYYVNPICTPSRSALMTGKYPIHTGMQHTVLYAAEPRGLPLDEKLLPQYLNDLGYSSHMVGKWHLGHYKRLYTPLYRGFKSHVGFWTGHQDYYDHTAVEQNLWGLDMRRDLNVADDLHGNYTTDVITNEAVSIIQHHNDAEPLFLYVAHAAVHSANPYDPLQANDETIAKMAHINDFKRRKYAAMVSKLDDSVGEIVKALQTKKLLKDTIIVFSTDNGGPADGFNLNHASNWPLRGVKNTLWEGGVRGVGLIWSNRLKTSKRVSDQLIHITDWLPTLYTSAGGDISDLSGIDGYSLWEEISMNTTSKRREVLHNIDDIWNSAAITADNWKILKGTNYEGQWDSWYGPPGERDITSYQLEEVLKSKAGKAIKSIRMMPTRTKILDIRSDATVKCISTDENSCNPLNRICLYNIKDDPCELFDVASSYPAIVELLKGKLQKYNLTAIKPGNLPRSSDANPKLWHNTWINFGDY